MLNSLLQSKWQLRALAVVLLGAMTTGCYTTTFIPPDQLLRLAVNGSMPGEPRVVHDVDDKPVSIGDSYSVKIDPRPGLPAGWSQWGATSSPIKSPFAAEVRGPLLFIQGEHDAQVTQIPLAYVQQIRVREYSHGKTAAVAIGATLGGIAAFVAIGVLVAATRPIIN
jgi:hypothetical protein